MSDQEPIFPQSSLHNQLLIYASLADGFTERKFISIYDNKKINNSQGEAGLMQFPLLLYFHPASRILEGSEHGDVLTNNFLAGTD